MDTKPDKKCVDEIFKTAEPYYSGQWISGARKDQKAGQFLEATHAYEKARNGFGQKSQEWKCLEAWRAYMEEKALATAPKLVLVMMKDEFYQQLEISPLPLPVPVTDTEAMLRQDQWTFAGLLDNLRYYLLANESEASKYVSILVRLAYEVAMHEGLHGDIDKADYYFGIAKDYGRGSLTVIANVAYGYLKARDYDKALKEFEQARKMLVKAESFMPAIWLYVANLHFYFGSKIKGKNVMLDYIAQAELLPGDLPTRAVEYAFKWAAKHKAEKGLVEILKDYMEQR